MDFSQIRKWMQKMNNILEMYAQEESFTESEKNLLLDYNQRIREAIEALKLEMATTEMEATVQEVQAEVEVKKQIASPTAEPKKSIKSASAAKDLSRYAELLQIKDSGDLSGKLESTPIKDIASAFGLNERIVCQNILFDGDKSLFDATVEKLNGMSNFQEASQFLCSDIVDRFQWMDEAKMKNAQIFLKLIRRRYS